MMKLTILKVKNDTSCDCKTSYTYIIIARNLSDSNVIWTNNQLVCKQTPNHLVKLTKWLNCVVSTYLYGAFDCMLLLCHLGVLEWIYSL